MHSTLVHSRQHKTGCQRETRQIREILKDDAEDFKDAYGVTRQDNLEGKDILEFVGDMDQRPALAEARRRLFSARSARVHPGRDEKVLTSWNGLMLAAFAEAAAALNHEGGDPERAHFYRQVAEENAEFLLYHLQSDTGRLFHSCKASEDAGEQGTAKIDGFLEDYANLAEGLLALYQATFDPRWYQAAHDLVDDAIALFWVPGVHSPPEMRLPSSSSKAGTAGFYDTAAIAGADAEALITHPRDLQDNAKLSALAIAAFRQRDGGHHPAETGRVHE